ncbi:MAG: biotin/lipoyl-binding protein [Gemmatimonadetes bacterium]|nr:biotin/lipoyl-binding protein [Gemmatimonadota bacterium]
MKYAVEVNGQRVDIALEEGGVRVLGDEGAAAPGAFASAHLEQVDGTPVYMVRLGEAVHRVVVSRGETKGSYALWIDGHRFAAEALDERTRAIRELTAAAAGAQGPRPLVAPMPGLIVRLHVKVGDEVIPGQPLVSMEAMKMENELRSLSGGRVTAIPVAPGQPVEKGAVLVELA